MMQRGTILGSRSHHYNHVQELYSIAHSLEGSLVFIIAWSPGSSSMADLLKENHTQLLLAFNAHCSFPLVTDKVLAVGCIQSAAVTVWYTQGVGVDVF